MMFAAHRQRRRAHQAYVALVAQARSPFLYAQCGVPDTLDGRFDTIVLHVFLFQRAQAGEAGFIRLVNEAFIADMDRSLREMGVGDMGVGKRVKTMGSALLGRLAAYEAAWENDAMLREALVRNLYRGAPPSEAQLQALLRYLRAYQATSNSAGGAAVSAIAAA